MIAKISTILLDKASGTRNITNNLHRALKDDRVMKSLS